MNSLDEREATANLRFVGRLGVNNPYVMVMLKSRAAELGIHSEDDSSTLEHLARVSRDVKLKLGSSYGFFSRPDGYRGLVAEYGNSFVPQIEVMTHEQKTTDLLNGKIDVTDFYGTDPPLHDDDERFVVLQDNREFFPDYWIGVFLRDEFAADNPKVVEAISTVKGITNKDMARLIQEATEAGLSMDTLSRRVNAQARLHDIVKKFANEKGLFN